MTDEIRALVAQEGTDAAAEERIVLILATRVNTIETALQYISTDEWRRKIRKEQGR